MSERRFLILKDNGNICVKQRLLNAIRKINILYWTRKRNYFIDVGYPKIWNIVPHFY